MFWKKQKNNAEMIFHDGSQNQRYAFRYRSGDISRPDLVFLGHRVKLLDISASGLSFKNECFAAGDRDEVELFLNDPELQGLKPLSVTIKILMIDGRDVCHCCFEKMTQEQEESLHRYVLKKQKAAIRKRKKRDTSY